MSAGKDEADRPQAEDRSFEAGRTSVRDEDIAGVMDGGDAGVSGAVAARKIFQGLGEDSGVVEDSADAAQAEDETPAGDAR